MKKIKYLMLLLACVSFCSCKTYSVMDNAPTNAVSPKLPNFNLELDDASFTSVAGLSTTYGDIRAMFKSDMYNNIVEKDGMPVGKIVCRVTNGKSSNHYVGLCILSGLSLCTLNLLGMPFAYDKTTLSITCDFYDTQNALISSYTSSVYTTKKYAALYYGYGDPDYVRVANVETFRKCLEDINGKIASDYSLREKFKKSEEYINNTITTMNTSSASYTFEQFASNNYDINDDGSISQQEAGKVTKIDCSNKNLSSLKGIEKFVNLEVLYCQNNDIEFIDLTPLKQLKKIRCEGNANLKYIILNKGQEYVFIDVPESKIIYK